MKTIIFGNPYPGGFESWVEECFRAIERASREDIEATVSAFKISGTVTTLRTINAETATIDDLRNFISTLISDINRKGQKRSYG